MRVFGIERPEDVTPNDRRNAKAVNFGVVYGISDFGLSNNLGISRKEAKAYIDTYFERFPGIKNYMDEVVREARDKGYVETLFKRRRELPDINSRNFNIRGFAERTAINSPIQGSAADILKIAMIQLDKALVAGCYHTKMLLQVHDEIVLEVPKSELAEMKKLVKQTMEEAIQLSVPPDCWWKWRRDLVWGQIKNRLLDKKNPLEHYGSKGIFLSGKDKSDTI